MFVCVCARELVSAAVSVSKWISKCGGVSVDKESVAGWIFWLFIIHSRCGEFQSPTLCLPRVNAGGLQRVPGAQRAFTFLNEMSFDGHNRMQ